MFQRDFLGLIGLAVLISGSIGVSRAEEAQQTEAVRVASASAEKPGLEVTEPVIFYFEVLMFEVRWDVTKAMIAAGFRELGSNTRFVTDMDSDTSLASLTRAISEQANVNILSNPSIRCLDGHRSEVYVGHGASKIQFLKPSADGAFVLEEVNQSAGVHLNLTPRSGAGNEIVISDLKFSQSTLNGREPVPGVNLEIGKPIFTTTTLETAMTITEEKQVHAIVAPSHTGRHLVLLVKSRQGKVAGKGK